MPTKTEQMKRITILAVLLLLTATAGAQDFWKVDPGLEAALREDLTRCGTNHSPYLHGDLRDTPPPAGYKPFYISHYARHGSRHSWGDRYYVLVSDVLSKADSLGILSPAGREALEQTLEVAEAWDGMDGRLSQRGVKEHSDMGHRMVKRFPQVFRGAPKIRSISSTVQRCIVSMNAMTTAISADRPKVQWTLDTGERFMDYISDTGTKVPACNEIQKPYREHLWDAPCDSLALLSVLFTDPAAARTLVPSLDRFHRALFRIATISDCWYIKDRILKSLPFEYLYRFCSYESHDIVARFGHSAEIGEARFSEDYPLGRDFVEKADEAVAGGEYAVDLRFGHDYPMIYFCAWLGIEGPGSRLSVDEVDAKWWGWEQLCMGSNLQAIFYRNGKGHVLVKFLYQEQERTLRGIESFSGPYYDWALLRSNIEGYKR